MASVAHFSTGHEQTQYNQVCCFQLFGIGVGRLRILGGGQGLEYWGGKV